MKTFKNKIAVIILAISIYSCKIPHLAQPVRSMAIPESFNGNMDSTNSGMISWSQFFSDTNLISLIDTAIANNWNLQIAFQRIQAARSDIMFAKGALKPVVDATGLAGVAKYGSYTMDGAGNKGTEIYNGEDIPRHLPDYFIGLQASWELDLWNKLKNQKKSAIARFLSTVEGKNLVVTELVSQVASSYYELASLDETLRIATETIKVQQNALDIVKEQKEAGVTNELAVKQFEAQLMNVRGLRQEILRQISETENRVNQLTGKFPQAVVRDTAVFNNSLPFQVKAGIPSALLHNRPDIRQAEFELQSAKADVLAARASFLPSLTINGSIGYQAFRTALLFTMPESFVYNALGSLTTPLINRAAIRASFTRANAIQLDALYNYHKVILDGFIETYNEMQRVNHLQQLFELKFQESAALTQSIEISEELFKTGRATYLEVLIAQQNALNAKLELVETKKNQFLTAINLYKALGGGWR